jgi:hypothetical protein
MDQSPNIALKAALVGEAQLLAQEEGLPVDQVVNDALEQGLLGLRSAHFFKVRRGKGDVAQALELLRRAGSGNPPLPGDELPLDLIDLIDPKDLRDC